MIDRQEGLKEVTVYGMAFPASPLPVKKSDFAGTPPVSSDKKWLKGQLQIAEFVPAQKYHERIIIIAEMPIQPPSG